MELDFHSLPRGIGCELPWCYIWVEWRH